jgi:hypothetical protein
MVGTRQSVLVERSGDRGHSEGFADIALAAWTEPGTIVHGRVANGAAGALVLRADQREQAA